MYLLRFFRSLLRLVLYSQAVNAAMVPSYANIVDMHLALLQMTTIFGFIFATINTAMVPNYANIVDIHLVLLQVTTPFGFIRAITNTAMVPNNADTVDHTLVLPSGDPLFLGFKCAITNTAMGAKLLLQHHAYVPCDS